MFARQSFMRMTMICAALGLAQAPVTGPLAGQEIVTSILAKSDSGTPAATPRAQGLDLAIALRASTLGVGAEVSKLVTGHLGIRAGANVLNYNRAQTVSGVDYAAQLNFRNYTAVMDLFPSHQGSFHFTGGIVGSSDAVNATGVATSSGSIKLNGTDYTSAQVGVLTGKLAFPSTGGYVGIGWGSPARHGGRVRLVFDLGAVIGSPTLDLHASNESSDAQLAAAVTAQREKTQSDINRYVKVWPVVSTGLSVHF